MKWILVCLLLAPTLSTAMPKCQENNTMPQENTKLLEAVTAQSNDSNPKRDPLIIMRTQCFFSPDDALIMNNIESLDILVEKHNDFARHVRSQCLTVIGEYIKANQDLTYLIENHAYSDMASLYSSRGSNYFNLNLIDKAIADYTSSISYDRNSFAAYMGRGDAYRVEGTSKLFISDYLSALKLVKLRHPCTKCNGMRFPEVDIYIGLLKEYEKNHNIAKYNELLHEAKQRNPESQELTKRGYLN